MEILETLLGVRCGPHYTESRAGAVSCPVVFHLLDEHKGQV